MTKQPLPPKNRPMPPPPPSRKSEATVWTELVQLRDDLDSEMVSLNSALEEFERALGELRLGVYAEVLLSRDEESDEATYLAYGRDGASWHLLRVLTPIGGAHGPEEIESARLITNASKWDRMTAARKLPDLLVALRNAATSERKRLAETTASVKDSVRQLRGGDA